MGEQLRRDLEHNGTCGTAADGVVLTFLRLEAVKMATGLGRATIYELMAEGKFPRPVKLGEDSKAVGWVSSEIADWQKARIAARDKTQAA